MFSKGRFPCCLIVKLHKVYIINSVNNLLQYSASGRNMPWLPVLDTYLTSDSPFFKDTWDNLMTQALARSKPILTGINSDEGIIKFGKYTVIVNDELIL